MLANYYQNHPDLDDPEIFIRTEKGKKAEKVFKDLCKELSKEISNIKL